MVRRSGDRVAWLLVVALPLLLGLLAVLQYRWTGEIGRAEHERLQLQLDASARRFAAALDREVAQAFVAFATEPGPPPAERHGVYEERLAAWRSKSEHPELVAGVALASREPSDALGLEAWEEGKGFVRTEWPPELQELRRSLEGDEGPARFAARLGAVFGDPPRVVVPSVEAIDAEGPASRRAFPIRPGGFGGLVVQGARGERPRSFLIRSNGFVILGLDAAYLSGQLLPRLAEAHFGPLAGGDYVVAVFRRADRSLVYSSDSALAPEELWQGDERVDLLGLPAFAGGPDAGRMREVFERFRASRPRRAGEAEGAREEERGAVRGARKTTGPFPQAGGADDRAPRPAFDVKLEDRPTEGESPPRGFDVHYRRPPGAPSGPWLLVVRHRGGSLAAAVAAARRRNLAVSLGILALLGAAAGLLAAGGQRARRLARQQLEFVAGVTHELHTPLTAIRSAGQNLADGIVSDPDHVRRYGGLIQREGGRLAAAVAQVLEFAGIESGGRAYAEEPIALAPLVAGVVRDLGLVLEESGLRVEQHVPDDLPDVRGDPSALRRVFENLLSNAAKFAAEGGLVTVGAARGEDGRAVVVRVEDRGPGILRSERERVFEPFFRGSAAREKQAPGSGLGLSLVRRIVEAHGGRARVEAGPEGGAAIVLELPAVAHAGGISA